MRCEIDGGLRSVPTGVDELEGKISVMSVASPQIYEVEGSGMLFCRTRQSQVPFAELKTCVPSKFHELYALHIAPALAAYSCNVAVMVL